MPNFDVGTSTRKNSMQQSTSNVDPGHTITTDFF